MNFKSCERFLQRDFKFKSCERILQRILNFKSCERILNFKSCERILNFKSCERILNFKSCERFLQRILKFKLWERFLQKKISNSKSCRESDFEFQKSCREISNSFSVKTPMKVANCQKLKASGEISFSKSKFKKPELMDFSKKMLFLK